MDRIEEGESPRTDAGWLDRIEALYLKVLRAALLAVATVLLLCAIGWATISLVRVMRSPTSVVEQPSAVTATEIVTPATNGDPSKNEARIDTAARARRSFYDGVVRRYYSLYRQRYQPFLRADDKKLTAGEFDDLTLDTTARMKAIEQGDLDFETDRRDLEAYLPIIGDASAAAGTTARLGKYRQAVKRPVATSVQRVRYETRRGWDTLSTSCAGWYESPIGCPVTRTIDVPYTERKTEMRYPDGVSSPNEILKTYQDRYFSLLADRRASNASKADRERMDIVDGQILGWAGLWRAVGIASAFLILMFAFLLVAIERHQRRLTAAVH